MPLVPLPERHRLPYAVTTALLVSLLLPLAGCGKAHLFYDSREIRHDGIQPKQKRGLADLLAGRLAGRTVVWVDAKGVERSIEPDVAGLNQLGLAELGALWLATSTGDRGGENDLRVHVGRRGSVPVSVLMDLEGNVRVFSGADGASPSPAPLLSETEIRRRFQLKKDMPGTWDDAERRALTEALSALKPGELRALQQVIFERRNRSPKNLPGRAALYELNGCRAVIYLFSSGVETDRYRFVGDASAPRNATLHSIVHEIGHAFEQAKTHERYCKAERSSGRMRDRLIREGNALMTNSPVVTEYLRVLDGLPAPTEYGNSSPAESFAESFALFHVDPAALKRTRPAVYAWFAAGGHLEALGW